MGWVVGIMPVDSADVTIKGQGHRGRKKTLKNPHNNNINCKNNNKKKQTYEQKTKTKAHIM